MGCVPKKTNQGIVAPMIVLELGIGNVGIGWGPGEVVDQTKMPNTVMAIGSPEADTKGILETAGAKRQSPNQTKKNNEGKK